MENKMIRLPLRSLLILFTIHYSLFTSSQTVMDLIREKPQYASCNYNTYPDTIKAVLTPAPAGKKPFYMSHYGRHGSRYISSRTGYDTPYDMMNTGVTARDISAAGRAMTRPMT